jgi:head-tail adaptor
MKGFVQVDTGSLRNRVRIESPANTLDAQGDWTNNRDDATRWVLQREIWASITYIQGLATENNKEGNSVATVRVTARFQPDLAVSTAWRLNWNGQLFEILWADNDEARNRQLNLMCREWQQ